MATLSRFYALHVVILPLFFMGVIGLYLLGVQLHGISKGAHLELQRYSKKESGWVINYSMCHLPPYLKRISLKKGDNLHEYVR